MRKNVKLTTCLKMVVFVSFSGIFLYYRNMPGISSRQTDAGLVVNTNGNKLYELKDLPQEAIVKCSSVRELTGHQEIIFPNDITWEQIYTNNDNVNPGGQWSPKNCQPEENVAIIIAYRDREEHLKHFLNYIHPFLQRQKISYRIIVVEQNSPAIFNKASLFNAAFKIISKLGVKYSCFIFHDVDIFPEDDRTIYSCEPKTVLHLAAYIDVHNYEKPHYTLTGGVIAITPESFKTVNGYSNSYWGWGGEDNDFLSRCLYKHVTFRHCRNSTECRYTTIKHRRDEGNPPNYVHDVLNKKPPDLHNDGLSTVNFTLHAIRELKLFTWLYVSLSVSTLSSDNTRFYGAEEKAIKAFQESGGRRFDEYLW